MNDRFAELETAVVAKKPWPERGMKSGSCRGGGATVVGFESGQWLLMIGRHGLLGQVLS